MEKGKHIGVKSVLEDPRLLHCLQAGRLASDQEYRKDALMASGQYHLTPDMIHLVAAKSAQALASDQDYRKRLHKYTVLPDDMKVTWAKKAYDLQSEVRRRDNSCMQDAFIRSDTFYCFTVQKLYKSDLNFMKGVAWDGVGAPQLESAKKAGDLISDVSMWKKVMHLTGKNVLMSWNVCGSLHTEKVSSAARQPEVHRCG